MIHLLSSSECVRNMMLGIAHKIWIKVWIIQMGKKKKIVFFTGAGMSLERALPTCRGEGGVWNEIDYEKVATLKSW